MSIKRKIKKLLQLHYKRHLGFCGVDNDIHFPCHLGEPSHIFLHDYTLVQPGCRFIIHSGKVVIGKWSSLSCNCMVITGNHKPTVGLNQRLIGRYHINDVEKDVLIDEDCWIGAGVTLLSGTHLHRGTVVGAASLVNKEFPPYAVLVGCPARIIASKFTLEQVIEHEKYLYPENERLSREDLTLIFDKYYSGKRSIGVDEFDPSYAERLAEVQHMQFRIPGGKKDENS